VDRTEPAKETIITPEQRNDGWLIKDGQFIRERRFEIIRRLPNGNFVVVSPEWTAWKEESDRG
jgi:hypothetical protein